jgi:hypothetical protein
MNRTIVCRLKTIAPAPMQSAGKVKPAQQPVPAAMNALRERLTPAEIALIVGKRWPPTGVRLGVKFLDGASTTLRRRILSHMNAWSKTSNVLFSESRIDPEVRITRFDSPPDMAGYWSYEGTDILGIEPDEPTMNLESFTTKTPAAEYRRVVRHEAGHTLGFPHEHMRRQLVNRIDVQKAIRYFRREEGWTAAETRDQVLTPIEEATILGTLRANPNSIMCYQLPGAITKDGRPILGGLDIDPDDYAFAAAVYPKPPVRISPPLGALFPHRESAPRAG